MTLIESLNDLSCAKLRKLAQDYNMPESVQAVDIDQDVGDLPMEAFGDPSKRRYPCHSKEATWLSRHMFEMDRGGYRSEFAGLISGRLETAEKLHGVEACEPKPMQKAASAPVSIDVTHDDNSYKVELRTAEEAREAVSRMRKSASTYQQRRSFAEGLVTQAPGEWLRSFDAPALEWIQKCAGLGMTTIPNILDMLHSRSACFRREAPQMAETMQKVASELTAPGFKLTPACLDKIAGLLDICDRGTGLCKHYGEVIKAPEELFETTIRKVASLKESTVSLTNGREVEKSALLAKQAKAAEFFTNFYGENPLNDSNFYDVISSLPRSDADAFSKAVLDA
jgi:hypothetical protein